MAQVLSEFLVGSIPLVVSVVFVVYKVALKQGFLRTRQLFLVSYATMLHIHEALGTGTAGYSTTLASLVPLLDLIRQSICLFVIMHCHL